MNFKKLDDLIHSGAKEIVLDCDVFLSDGEAPEYQKGIELDMNIVIDGDGHAIDAGGKCAIFHIAGGEVTIKNTVFKNGNSNDEDDYGIFNEADLTLVGCSLSDNPTAILNEGSLSVEECIFKHNSIDGWGAAIFDIGKVLKIRDSIFEANSCEMGGAIYSDSDLILRGCEFKDNKSQSGGAIYAEGKLMAKDCTFKDNHADEGGAIKAYGNCSIFGCVFKANSSPVGGAIYNCGNLAVIGCSFKSGKSSRAAAIFNDGEVNVERCDFKSNESESDGGAIYNSGVLNVFASGFCGNHSFKSAGAIFNDSKGISIVFDSQFSTNEASENGGAISNASEGILSISDSAFSRNGSDFGGAVYDEGILEVVVCRFENNAARISEGTIWSRNKEKLKLNNSIFKGNEPDDVY